MRMGREGKLGKNRGEEGEGKVLGDGTLAGVWWWWWLLAGAEEGGA
jgi:hypothetical protein